MHAVRLCVASIGVLSIDVYVVIALISIAALVALQIFRDRSTNRARTLSEKQIQLEFVLNSMADGVIILDLAGDVVLANYAATQLLGLPDPVPSVADLQEAFDLWTPDDELLALPDWPSLQALQGNFLQHRELKVRQKHFQKEFYVDISTTPIRNEFGKTVQILLIYRDITERFSNTHTRARLAAIVESSEDAIVGKDTSGIVTSWNAAAERIFGYTADEMIGHSILKILPSDLRHEEQEFLDRIKRGETIETTETIRRTKSGKSIHVSLTISPIRDANGRVVGASKMARDITARKQLERQLQQSQKMEAIGQLTGGIAHDFNNLLCVIVGNLSLLERSLANQEFPMKRVQTALKAADRGADLTRRLLAFSSNEELMPAPVILAESVRNTIELASRTLGPEIKIVANLDETMASVFVDPGGLESALLNLVVNARDAMPKGGTLTITTQTKLLDEKYPPVQTAELKPGRYASVSVGDSGSGMSRETLERAFEPFFTTKARGKGTGLGLAMVYGFIKQSGGTVRLYSELGYGTIVTIYLPFAHEDALQTPATSTFRAGSVRACKVLAVDDETDLLEVAVTYLEELGCRVIQAMDGPSALKIIEKEKDIDLIITDVIMPGGMNGAELVSQIRTIIPDIKVIYSSGFPADALSERSGTIIDGLLLRKPYQRAEFEELVHKALSESGCTTSKSEKIQSGQA